MDINKPMKFSWATEDGIMAQCHHGRVLRVLLKGRKPEGKAFIYKMNWFLEVRCCAKQFFSRPGSCEGGDRKGLTKRGEERGKNCFPGQGQR